MPLKHDIDGISFTRAAFHSTPAGAATGPSNAGYYLAHCRAKDLRSDGIEIAPSPTALDPGHAHAPAMKYTERKTDRCQQWAMKLATQFTFGVSGPYNAEP